MCPAPADLFEYAKLAAQKLFEPKPADERANMVQEILTAEASDYPSERVFKKVSNPSGEILS